MVKKTTEQFIEDAIKIHGNKFDYSLVEYKGVKNKVKIKCSESHVFEQTPNDHLNGHGCKICSGWGLMSENPNEFINRADKIHNNKYDYSKTKYIEHSTPLVITCKIHGDFKMAPKEHIIKKAGCQKCSMIVSTKKRTWDLEKFIIKAKEIHGNNYDYSESIYIKAYKKLNIKCKIHGLFSQTPKEHINQKHGCPICSSSKGEKKVEKWLRENNINFIPQHKFNDCKNKRKLPFDFYLPDFNTVIEYHGEQHYKKIPFFENRSGGLKGLKERDKLKEKFCKLNNISYIKISYKEFENLENILKSKLC
jgi:hypothetical protein